MFQIRSLCPIFVHSVQFLSLRPIFFHFVHFEIMWSHSSGMTHFQLCLLLTVYWTIVNMWMDRFYKSVKLMCYRLLRSGSLYLLNRATLLLRCGLWNMHRTRFYCNCGSIMFCKSCNVFVDHVCNSVVETRVGFYPRLPPAGGEGRVKYYNRNKR